MREEDKKDLVFLDIRFSNQCNFKCRMCSERDSTSWYDEKREWNEKNGIPFDSKKLHILNNDFSKEDLEHLEYVYIAGGEPLYTKKAWDFIETIPHPQNVDLQFQTNLSILNYKDKNIFELTKGFKKVIYSISMDGLFEVGEFGRTNFKTDVFLANLNKLNEVKKEYNNIVYDFTYTSSILNVFSFFETFDYLIDNGYINDYSNIRFQFVRYPDILDTKNFNVLFKAKEYYERRHTLKGIEHSPFLLGDIENLLIYLEKENNTNTKEYLEKLKNYLIFSENYNNIKIPSTLNQYISLI
jgi:organic radical activating enzyme